MYCCLRHTHQRENVKLALHVEKVADPWCILGRVFTVEHSPCRVFTVEYLLGRVFTVEHSLCRVEYLLGWVFTVANSLEPIHVSVLLAAQRPAVIVQCHYAHGTGQALQLDDSLCTGYMKNKGPPPLHPGPAILKQLSLAEPSDWFWWFTAVCRPPQGSTWRPGWTRTLASSPGETATTAAPGWTRWGRARRPATRGSRPRPGGKVESHWTQTLMLSREPKPSYCLDWRTQTLMLSRESKPSCCLENPNPHVV